MNGTDYVVGGTIGVFSSHAGVRGYPPPIEETGRERRKEGRTKLEVEDSRREQGLTLHVRQKMATGVDPPWRNSRLRT